MVYAIPLIIWLGLLLPLIFGVFTLIKWRGGWRIAGVIPLAVLIVFFAPMVPGWIRDPSSNNLWGLLFIPLALMLCVYSAIVLLLRRRRTHYHEPRTRPD